MLREKEKNPIWQQAVEALTDPTKSLNSPIKMPEFTMDKETTETLYNVSYIIAGGLILNALISNWKR